LRTENNTPISYDEIHKSGQYLKNDQESGDEPSYGAYQNSKSGYAQATTTQTFSPLIPIEKDQFSPDKSQIDGKQLMNLSGNEFSKENHIVRNISLQPSINTSSQRKKREML